MIYQLLFKKYTLSVPVAKDQLAESLKMQVRTFPPAKWGFSCPCTPNMLFGTSDDETIHLFAKRSMFYSGPAAVLHGKLIAEDDSNTWIEYRVLPDTLTLILNVLYIAITLCYCIISKKPTHLWIVPLIPTVSCVISWLSASAIFEMVFKLGNPKEES